MSSDAVADIVYLSKRLKGIIELGDILTTREALDNQIKEFKNTLETLRQNVEDTNTEHKLLQEHLKEDLSNREKQLEEAKLEAKNIVDKANVSATEVLRINKTDADLLLNKNNEIIKVLEETIAYRRTELSSVVKDINKNQDKLNALKLEISNLKDKFSNG